MKYLIKGNTYHFKDDLKSLGCKWNPDKKHWETPEIEKDDFKFKRISSVVVCCDAKMIPTELSGEEKKIQTILGNF